MKKNKTKWIWIYDREKRRYIAIKDQKMPYKADHTRHAKSNETTDGDGREKQ